MVRIDLEFGATRRESVRVRERENWPDFTNRNHNGANISFFFSSLLFTFALPAKGSLIILQSTSQKLVNDRDRDHKRKSVIYIKKKCTTTK